MLDQSTETIILSEENDIREVSMVLARKLLHRTPEMGSLDANKATSILVIGLQNQVNKWLDLNNLPLRPSNMQNIGTAYVWTMRQEGKTFVIVSAKDALSLQYLVRPLPHYGRQSYIIFDGAKVIERGIWPAQVQEIVLN